MAAGLNECLLIGGSRICDGSAAAVRHRANRNSSGAARRTCTVKVSTKSIGPSGSTGMTRAARVIFALAFCAEPA